MPSCDAVSSSWSSRLPPARGPTNAEFLLALLAGAAAPSAVLEAAMIAAIRNPGDREASADDTAAVPPHGSFFGRRKGHRLRAHQADLIEQLLPRLALKIGGAHPPELATLFDAP